MRQRSNKMPRRRICSVIMTKLFAISGGEGIQMHKPLKCILLMEYTSIGIHWKVL